MKPIQVVVNINRATAIRAGKASYGYAPITVDPAKLPDDLRETLAKLSQTSRPQHEPILLLDIECPTPEVTPQTVELMLAAYRDKLAGMERKKAEEKAAEKTLKDKALKIWLEAPVEQLIYTDFKNNLAYKTPDWPFDAKTDATSEYLAKKAELEEEISRRQAENARITQELAKRAAEAELRRQAQLEIWVAEKATPIQKQRRHEGLMCDDEIVAGLQKEAWEPLSGLTVFKKITPEEIKVNLNVNDDDDDDDDDDYDYWKEEPVTVTDVEFIDFDRVRATIKKVYPNAIIKLLLHCGGVTYKQPIVRKLSARTTIEVGEFIFMREFAVKMEK